jgi:hypothetical protein
MSLKDKLDATFGGWVSVAAAGALLLHAMGFLSMRYYLTALGVKVDLSLIDSRYVFEGASCAVFLLMVLVDLLLLLLAASLALFLLSRLVPRSGRERLRAGLRARWDRLRPRHQAPGRLILVGIVFAVLTIQIVMKQCFQVQGLLFRGAPREPAWLKDLLLAPAEAGRVAFFMGLLAAVVLMAVLRLAAARGSALEAAHPGLGLLTVLLGLAVALLPINYGVLTSGRPIPRVAHLGDDRAFAGRQAWLVWEDRDELTLLVVSPAVGAAPPARALVTVPRKEAGKVEIGEEDYVLQRLAGAVP